jgi:copper chaperone CopZ
VNQEQHINIEGMSCMHCVGTVKQALESVAGVATVAVSLEPGSAVVSGTATRQSLLTAIRNAGYQVLD